MGYGEPPEQKSESAKPCKRGDPDMGGFAVAFEGPVSSREEDVAPVEPHRDVVAQGGHWQGQLEPCLLRRAPQLRRRVAGVERKAVGQRGSGCSQGHSTWEEPSM